MDTIAAIATAPGAAALAVIRVSGERSLAVCSKCLAGIEATKPREIRLYRFFDPLAHIVVDEVTAIHYQAPHSYTGEPMVEIICHGGNVVSMQILSSLLAAGARKAQRGEFSRRAVLNGKMSLLRAEAIREIIEENSAVGVANALANYFGGYCKVIEFWRQELIAISCELEAGIEFGEEEVDVAERVKPRKNIQSKLQEIRNGISKEIESRQRIKRASRGIVVAIIGPRNAGKSTLFNAILGSDRSIVHHEPGTTRDFISERIFLHGTPITLIDTAGIGESAGEVETLGIQKSLNYAREADLVIWVTPQDKPFSKEEKEIAQWRSAAATIALVSKIDLGPPVSKLAWFSEIGIAAIGANLISGSFKHAEIMELLGHTAAALFPRVDSFCVIQNERQEEIALIVQEKISDADEAIRKGEGEELVAELIRQALRALDEFEGRDATEETLNAIFSRFCIGK